MTVLDAVEVVEFPGIPGATTRLADGGTGDETLVLLHGLGNSLNYWHAVWQPLTARHRVVAIDIPGFGESRLPAGTAFSVEAVADAISSVLDQAGVSRPLICGHSMGAVLAAAMSLRQPTAGVILINGTVLSAVDCMQRPCVGVLRRPAVAVNLLAQGIGSVLPSGPAVARAMTSALPVRTALFHPFVRRPWRADAAALRIAIESNGNANSLDVLRLGREEDLRHLFAAVEAPTAVISTPFDRLVPADDVDEAVRLLSPVYVAQVPECGHWPMLEAPATTAQRIGDACEAILNSR